MKVASFGSCLSRRVIDHLEMVNSKTDVISCAMQLKVSDFIDDENIFDMMSLFKLATDVSNSSEVQLNIIQQHRDIAGIFRNANDPCLHPFKNIFEGKIQVDLILIDNFPELVFRSSIDEHKRRVFVPNVAQGNDVALDLLDYDPLNEMVDSYKEFLVHLRKSQPNAKIFFLNFPVALSKSDNIKDRGARFYDEVISKLPLKELDIVNFKMNIPRLHEMNPNYSHFKAPFYNMLAYRILGYFSDEKIEASIRVLSTQGNALFLNEIFPNVEALPIRIDSYIETYFWKSKIKDKKYHINMEAKKEKYLFVDSELILRKLNSYQSASHEGILNDLVSNEESRFIESSYLNINKSMHYLGITPEVKVIFNNWQKIDSSFPDIKVINRLILLERRTFNNNLIFFFSAEFENENDFVYAFKEYYLGLNYYLDLQNIIR